MTTTITQPPRILAFIQNGAPLDDLQATAAQLWLYHHGDAFDANPALRDRVAAYWQGRPGDDPYSDFLATRGACRRCGETYRYENLAVCPNCFATYCPRHNAPCSCGHDPVG